jgi:hypothetical protein
MPSSSSLPAHPIRELDRRGTSPHIDRVTISDEALASIRNALAETKTALQNLDERLRVLEAGHRNLVDAVTLTL